MHLLGWGDYIRRPTFALHARPHPSDFRSFLRNNRPPESLAFPSLESSDPTLSRHPIPTHNASQEDLRGRAQEGQRRQHQPRQLHW
jgi:hypothetical protein